MIDIIKKYAAEQLYICINPEFDSGSSFFVGWTPIVIDQFGEEYLGRPWEDIDSAIIQAEAVAKKMLKQKEDKKPLTLFNNKTEV